MKILVRHTFLGIFLFLTISNQIFAQTDTIGGELTNYQFFLFQDITNDEFLMPVRNERIKMLLETLDSTTIVYIVGENATLLGILEVQEFLSRLKFHEFGDFNEFSINKRSQKELTLQYTRGSNNEAKKKHNKVINQIKFSGRNKFKSRIDSSDSNNHLKISGRGKYKTGIDSSDSNNHLEISEKDKYKNGIDSSDVNYHHKNSGHDKYNTRNDSSAVNNHFKLDEIPKYDSHYEYKSPKNHNLRDYVVVSMGALGGLTSVYLANREYRKSRRIVNDVINLDQADFDEDYPEYSGSKSAGLRDANSKIDKALIYFTVGGIATITTTVYYYYTKKDPRSSGDLSFKINPSGASLVYSF